MQNGDTSCVPGCHCRQNLANSFHEAVVIGLCRNLGLFQPYIHRRSKCAAYQTPLVSLRIHPQVFLRWAFPSASFHGNFSQGPIPSNARVSKLHDTLLNDQASVVSSQASRVLACMAGNLQEIHGDAPLHPCVGVSGPPSVLGCVFPARPA